MAAKVAQALLSVSDKTGLVEFARGLVAHGLEPGERVALWMSDSPDWLVARWAVPMIGAVRSLDGK